MAVAGTEAKEKLINKIIAALGSDYVGCSGGKYYFNSMENGKLKQVCISMTCPKVTLESEQGDWDWSTNESTSTSTPINTEPAKITDTEINNLKAMLERLNL